MLVGILILGMILGAFTGVGMLVFGYGFVAALIGYATVGILSLLAICAAQSSDAKIRQNEEGSPRRDSLSQPTQKRLVRTSEGHPAGFCPESPPIGFKRINVLTRCQSAGFLQRGGGKQ